MKCSQCGHDNPRSLEACQKCGAPLVDVDEETLFDTSPSDTAGSPADVPTEYVPSEGTARANAASVSSGTGGSHPRSPTGQLLNDSVFARRYQILEVLGEGGMGVVYKAKDLDLEKIIALKTIRSERETDPEVVQRFKRELLLSREITHKNVVRIHDFGESDGIKYFTMAFIEGQSLKSLIRERGRIPVREALPLIRQILSALQEAHDQGVIHRDLKPQNIMLDRAGVPYIMDFGIARSAIETTDLTATGMMIGTPDYMSPEQVRGEKADAQSDLFSLGVILYEMLTGDLPYQADTPASKVMMRLSHRPRAPRQVTLEIPKYLEQVVLKCMEMDRTFRYESAGDALQDVDRQQVDSSITLKVQKAVAGNKTGLVAAAALVLAIGAAIYFAMRPASDAAEAVADAIEIAPTTLAILPFTNATGTTEHEWMRNGIPEMLVHDIGQSRYVRPVPGERVLKVMRDLGVSENTRFDEPTLESIASRVPADSLLYGQYVEAGGQLRLDLTVRKSSTGVPTPISAEMPASEVFALVDRLTENVKANLDLPEDALKGDVDRPVTEVATGSLDALRTYERGLAELNQGNNQSAASLLEEATRHDPEFAMAYAKLAEAQFRLGQRHEAEAAIDRADRLAASRTLPLAERYQIHATAALVRDDYEVAAESFSELSKLYPHDPDIKMSLAAAYEELGHMPDARATYEDIVRIQPDYGAALLGLGRILVMGGDPPESIRVMRRALETGQFDDDPEALGMIHSILGVAHREIGELDTALEHLQISLDARTEAQDHRGRTATLGNIASIYEYQGNVDKALEAERDALAIAREIADPQRESIILNNMALTYQMAGRLDEALETFRESFRIEMERQDHAEMANRLDHIANIYQLMGQYDDAIVYLERAQSYLEQSEDRLETSINLGHIAAVRKAQGLYPEAIEAYLGAVAISNEISDQIGVSTMKKDLADIYMKQGRYADAYAALEQSLAIVNELEMQHDIAEVKAPLGHLLIQVGRLDDAEAELREAEHVAHGAEARDLLPEVHLGRAKIHDLRGEMEQAAAAYEEANVQANLSGKKEVAVTSRIELGQLFLQQNKIANAERMLVRTKEEAADARLRPLESEAAAALADVYLEKGDAESARGAALEAISIADKYSGRPTLVKAYASLGRALKALGRTEEAVDAHARSAEILDWIRGSLRPEHVQSFIARPDIHRLVERNATALEDGGREQQAASLRKWLASDP